MLGRAVSSTDVTNGFDSRNSRRSPTLEQVQNYINSKKLNVADHQSVARTIYKQHPNDNTYSTLAELAPMTTDRQNEAVRECISVGGKFELEAGWTKLLIN